MRELSKRDLHWTLRMAPRRVVELMRANRQCVMAGGFIRACVSGEAAQDVDLFAPDEERAGLYATILARQDGRVFKSPNAYTIRLPDARVPIQVIHRWAFSSPEECVESFDFTVAKSAVWCAGDRDGATHRTRWKSVCHDDFYADLAAKRLVYTSPVRNEDAGGSMLRVLKFYQRGYKIPLDSLAAVTARMVMGVKEEALTGLHSDREVAMAMALTGLLHEVDPLEDPEHLFHLPSETKEEEAQQ